MGDRGNIVVRSGDGDVWFYTHWSGSEIGERAKAGLLAGKGRWDDPPYLARIIFNALQEDDRGETGFGISTRMQDNEHPILVIDTNPPGGAVYVVDEKTVNSDGTLPKNGPPKNAETFAQFTGGK